MKQIFFYFLCIILLSGCSSMQGIKSVDEEINQTKIADKLIREINPDENLTVINSLIQASQNLEDLQIELIDLNNDIEQINYDINYIANNPDLNDETLEYLEELNKLTNKSNLFIQEVHKSTKAWENYIKKFKLNSTSVNFTSADQELIDSVNAPLKVFYE